MIREAWQSLSGIIMLSASGTCTTGIVIMGKLLKSWQWPFVRMMGFAAFTISFGIAIALCRAHGSQNLPCQRREVKWIILRGFFGSCQFMFAILAVFVGAGVGDLGALSSINTIVAALLGRAFLGEKLGIWHIMAVFCSVIGAVLIAGPGEIASRVAAEGNQVIFGYLFALLSGTAFGCMFICVRKTTTASPWLLTMSAMSQRGMICWIFAASGLVDDNALGKLSTAPRQTAGFLLLLVISTLVANYLASAGAKRSPAAISATVFTAVSMSVGYAAQVAIFRRPPSLLTIAGAVLMLVAVVMMAFARLPPRRWKAQPTACLPSPSPVPPQNPESLADFVASEYAEQMPPLDEHEAPVAVTPSLRLRPSGGAAMSAKGLAAASIGVSVPVVQA